MDRMMSLRRFGGRLAVGAALVTAAVLLSGAGQKPLPLPNIYQVRIAYIIPADRQPQADYEAKAALLLARIQTFYADEMQANGFGRMSFSVESDKSEKPVVHVIHSQMTAAVFADTGHARYVTGKYWEHAFQSVIDAGFAADAPGQIWLCFAEAQDQLPDGSIHNDTTQGTGRFGNGFALCTGLELAIGGDANLIHDHRNYDKLTLGAFGPHPLQLHRSFPAYQGDDVSALAADYIGATAHELGHCFLLQHCYLNDDTHCGNLMGNGFRGWRGYLMPQHFPDEDTRLDRPSALMLSLCPFFRKDYNPPEDATPPIVSILTPPGPMVLTRGILHFSFSAAEAHGPGIALAVLENGQGRDGVGVVAWKEFKEHPRQVQSELETNLIDPGREDTWRLTVLDAAGNVSYQTLKLIAPRTGIGPFPFMSVAHSTLGVDTPIHFRGSVKRPWQFLYQWDFGDGSIGQGPSINHSFAQPGVYDVRLQVVDPARRVGTVDQYMWVRASAMPDR